MSRQLAFSLPSAPVMVEETFYVSDANQEAYQTLVAWPEWPEARTLYLWGEEASGKSHLASLWQARSSAEFLTASRLTQEYVLSRFQEQPCAFILEDAEGVKDQRALFHLLNLVREKQGALLMTSAILPAQLPFRLPDLTSRLKGLPVLKLGAPGDDLLKALLIKRFSDVHLKVSTPVLDYTLKHLDRSYRALDDLVRLVDKLNWQERRPLTLPFLKRAFSLLQSAASS